MMLKYILMLWVKKKRKKDKIYIVKATCVFNGV